MLRLNELKNVGHTMWQPVKEVGKNFPSPYASLFCAAYAFWVTWSELQFVLATSTNALTAKTWEDQARKKIGSTQLLSQRLLKIHSAML